MKNESCRLFSQAKKWKGKKGPKINNISDNFAIDQCQVFKIHTWL